MDEWQTIEPDVLYGESYYAVADYWADEDWTLTQEPDGFVEPGGSN